MGKSPAPNRSILPEWITYSFPKGLFEKIHRLTFRLIDYLTFSRWLLTVTVVSGLTVVVIYLSNIETRNEHWPTYLFFGIVTSLGFFVSYMVLHYIRPITGMREYVEFLTYVLEHTIPGDELVILASTPNPGLAEYLMSNREHGHYYLRYVEKLKEKVQTYNKNGEQKIRYRILPYGSPFPARGDDLDTNSKMMQFLQPFIGELEISMQKVYKDETVALMNSIKTAIDPTAPVLDGSKGFLIISHNSMGFLGVYSAQSGILTIRGMKIFESLFLKVLKEICALIQPRRETPPEATQENGSSK